MHLLDIARIVRNAVPSTPDFNLFSAIGYESNEVRLHSKLIAALICRDHNPYSEESLRALLRHFGIPLEGENSFVTNGIQVRTEYQGIDILITNDSRQAIIIENKIYAGDQLQQLRRYYTSVRELGYSTVYVRYLTLDGREPTPQSLDGLDTQLGVPAYGAVGYATEVKPWLEELAGIAARNSALRETIFQYQAVIDKLTGRGQAKHYMNELVKTLLHGNNMLLARDITAAYTQGLEALQEQFWADLIEACRQAYPEMSHHLSDTSAADPQTRKSAIQKYYAPGKRERMYYGLRFKVPGVESVEVWFDIERAMYVGAFCERGQSSKDYRQIKKVLESAGLKGESAPQWPIWWYIQADHNFTEPNEALLGMLCNPVLRAEFVRACASSIFEIWQPLTGSVPE